MILNRNMQNIDTSIQVENNSQNIKTPRKRKNSVDINILLNKLRAEQKKEKIESYVLLGMVSTLIIVTGIVISL